MAQIETQPSRDNRGGRWRGDIVERPVTPEPAVVRPESPTSEYQPVPHDGTTRGGENKRDG